MDSCLLETTLTFEEDGDFHYMYSSADGEECSTVSDTGTWVHESGTTYRIVADGLPIGQGTQELTFSNNNNSFSFTEQLQVEELSGMATATFNMNQKGGEAPMAKTRAGKKIVPVRPHTRRRPGGRRPGV